MGENKHLTPVWIVYVDGKRLDTDHEGALERMESEPGYWNLTLQ